MGTNEPSDEGVSKRKWPGKGGAVVWPQKGPPMKEFIRENDQEREGTLVWAHKGPLMRRLERENGQERGDPGLDTKRGLP